MDHDKIAKYIIADFPAFVNKNSAIPAENMAGLTGFEPVNDGVKVRCLTAWRQPNTDTENTKCPAV